MTATAAPGRAGAGSLATRRRQAVPTILQMSEVECGAACLGMILAHHGRWVPLTELRAACGISRDGATALDIVHAAARYGLTGQGHLGGVDQLDGLPVPAIIYIRHSHFVVLEGARNGTFHLNDPASGPYRMTAEELTRDWSGAALTFTPTDGFRRGGHRFRISAALAARLRRSGVGVGFAVAAGLLALVLGLVSAPIQATFVTGVLGAGRRSSVATLAGALVAVGLVRLGLALLEYGALTRLQTKLSLVGSASFVDHLVRLPVQFYLQRSAGDLSQRVVTSALVAQLLATQLAAAGVALIGVVAYGVLLLSYQWQLGLAVIALSSLDVVALRAVLRRRETAQAKVVHVQNELRGTTVSAIRGIETLKATGMEDDVFVSLTGQQARYVSAQASLVTSTALLGAVPTLLLALTTASILVIGGWFVLDGSFTFGGLLAVQTLAANLNAPIQTLMGAGTQIQVMTAGVQSLDDVLANPPDARYAAPTAGTPTGTGGTGAAEIAGALSLEDVTFGYSATRPPIVRGLDLAVAAGRRIALVGVTGAGKTTIGNLAAGLLEPWHGRVLIDGRPQSDWPPRALAGARAKVDQTIVLFEGTVRENVTLWDGSVPDADVVAALADARLLDEVLARPGGLDARVDEDGRNLSGGQRQRLELARALATNPRVVILDEATSALDATTEKAVDDGLRARGVTCLIIAHRLSTIRDADEIVVLGRGGVVIERGTHDELMVVGGEYRRLVGEAGDGGDVGS